MTDDRKVHDDGDRFDALIEKSSLGAPGARRLRQRISPAEAESILWHADIMEISSLEIQAARQIHSARNAEVVQDMLHGSLAVDTGSAAQIGGQVCAMLAVDMAEVTRADRDDEIQLCLRESMFRMVREANIGPVYSDEHGFSGADVTLLCRMLDAQPLRRALSESGSEFAFIISDYVYERLVLRRHSLADPRSFRRVRTLVKRTPVHAWMYLPAGMPP